MTNKNKIINQAQKFITKGQWDKAIKELQKLIAEDPKDVRTLLKLGDVHSKKGDREAATRVYRQVAESYSEQGFFLKAVAVYKQILKHDPKHMEVTLKLAELYEHLGLTSEAMGQYQVAAQIHEESGQMREALDVLRRMVEIDAENVASRIKLAESYSRESMVAEATAEFEKAAEILKRQNRTDDFLKVAERLVYHAPDRYDLLRDLAKIYLKRADAKRALAKLQICFKANPKDAETLNLLAQAFGDLGQTQKTIFVYKELQNVHRELGQLADVARVQTIINHLEGQGRGFAETSPPPSGSEGIFSAYGTIPPDSGSQSLSTIFPQAGPPVSGPDSAPFAPSLAPRSSARGPLTPAPEYPLAPPPRAPSLPPPPPPRAPSMAPRPPPVAPAAAYDGEELLLEDPVPASSPLTPRAPPREADADQITKILTETDVYVKYGLRDKALEHLRRVFQVDVDNLAAYAKMRDIYLSLGDTARAAEAVSNMVHVHARRGDADAMEGSKAELLRLAPGHPLLSGGLPGGMPPQPMSEDSLSIDIDEDSGVFEMVDFAEAGELEVDSGSIEFEVPEPGDPDIIGELAFEPAEDLAFELEMPAPGASAAPAEADWSASMPEDDAVPFDEERTVHAVDEPSLSGAAADLAFFEPPQIMTAPELGAADEFDFEEVSSSQLEPMETFDAPTQNNGEADPFGGNVVPFETTASADALVENEELIAAFASEEVTGETAPYLGSPAADDEFLEAASEESYEDEVAEVQFLMDQGLREEALEAVTALLDEAPNHPRARALLEQLREQAEPTTESPAINGAAGLVSQEPIDEQSASDHHDQGMLFMDLGRVDDAIHEFQQAARSPGRTVGALEMIGHCLVQQGQFDSAIEYYALALESGADGYAATNIKYEIGQSLESAGDRSGAIRWFRACHASDPTHRDVAERLANLGVAPDAPANGNHPPASEPPRGKREPGPSTSKKAKISYL